MRRTRVVTLSIAATVLLLAACPALVWAETVERVSVDTNGEDPNNQSHYSTISEDGRYVVFDSTASDLVEVDATGGKDLYVYDRILGETELVSVDSDGDQANASGSNYMPSITDDGRYISFTSSANNLVDGDTNGTNDIFVRDLQEGTTTRVSVSSDEEQATSWSARASIADDIESVYVAYQSNANNIGETADSNGTVDIYLSIFNKTTPDDIYTQRVSVDNGGGDPNSYSWEPSIAVDEANVYVAYQSWASDLVVSDNNGVWDIFVATVDKSDYSIDTKRASVASGGVQAMGDGGHSPSITADGQLVAYQSKGTNLVASDTNGQWDVFVTDWNHDDSNDIVTERVSVDSGESQAVGGGSTLPRISGDGRYVAFQSDATNLVSGDSNGDTDVFVRDRMEGTTVRVSTTFEGNQVIGNSIRPAITRSAGDVVPQVAFTSNSAGFDNDDENGINDIYVGTIDTTPTITSIVPARGSVDGGETVVIYGTNFVEDDGLKLTVNLPEDPPAGGSAVKFGDLAAASYTFCSTMKIIATTPAHDAGKVDVQVEARGGTNPNTAADDYTYVGPEVAKKPAAGKRYEQNDERILYTGGFDEAESDSYSAGSEYVSAHKDFSATITFKGTKLDWIGTIGPEMGQVMVSVDGGVAVLVDLSNPETLSNTLVWTTGDLAYGVHVVQIYFPEDAEAGDLKAISIDALDIYGGYLMQSEAAEEEAAKEG